MKFLLTMVLVTIMFVPLFSQHLENGNDTLSIATPPKVLHAEPLYIDLIRDLGARKGEKEWNIGMGMTDRLRFDSYEFLIEYEWAPIDRLGLEVELPVTIFAPTAYGANGSGSSSDQPIKPSNRIESLKIASQYTFFVSERLGTSLALGAITEFEFTDLNIIRNNKPFQGILYNPFFVAAKKWKNNLHTLIYTGPNIRTHFDSKNIDLSYEFNTNFHYMIPGTRNFVGVEFNKHLAERNFDMVIRPQMRLGISEDLMIGIVPGIPVSKEKERLSVFLRLIYEPGHHKRTKTNQ